MSKFRILGVALVAVFAVSVVVAATASAVEFLLALWLLNGIAVSGPVLADAAGDLILTSLNGAGLGIEVLVLCEGILDGFVESESLDLFTELLTLGGASVSSVPLVEPALECVNIQNCAEPLVWADNLPVETEAELMVDGAETFFVDLLLNAGYYVTCMALGFSELCEAAETAVELTNNAPEGTVDATFSEAFQLLAGLKLANCDLGGAETGEVNGLGTILDLEGTPLAVSE